MPIWLELLILSLVAYAIGVAVGWGLFGMRNRERG